MANTEKQILPGEPRVFEAKRDMKPGKNFVITQSGGVKFEMQTTYVREGDAGWKENTFQVVLVAGDELHIFKSDDKQFVEVEISSKEAVKNQRYRITKEVFEEVLDGVQIAVLKQRKIEIAQEEIASSVKDILAQLPAGTSFKVKEKVAEDMIFGRHGIKKGDEVEFVSLQEDTVTLKKAGKKKKTENAGEITMSVEDFERLLVDTGAINFRKKAMKLIPEKK